MASLLSVASSSSRCSFLRLALMRWDSSSASSSCRLSCLTFALPFSACRGGGRGQGSGRGALRWPPGGQGPRCHAPAPCTARRPCARPPPAAAPPSASCPSASATWRPLASLCAEGGVPLQLLCVSPRHLARGGPSSQPTQGSSRHVAQSDSATKGKQPDTCSNVGEPRNRAQWDRPVTGLALCFLVHEPARLDPETRYMRGGGSGDGPGAQGFLLSCCPAVDRGGWPCLQLY